MGAKIVSWQAHRDPGSLQAFGYPNSGGYIEVIVSCSDTDLRARCCDVNASDQNIRMLHSVVAVRTESEALWEPYGAQ